VQQINATNDVQLKNNSKKSDIPSKQENGEGVLMLSMDSGVSVAATDSKLSLIHDGAKTKKNTQTLIT